MLAYEVQYEKGRILNVRSSVTKDTLEAGVAVGEGIGARRVGARGIELSVLPTISYTLRTCRCAEMGTQRGKDTVYP